MKRDIDLRPYTPDENRVAEYIVELTGIGAGDDPIGFLMASHQELGRRMKKMRSRMSMEEFHKICYGE
jgi:hypothetical protein